MTRKVPPNGSMNIASFKISEGHKNPKYTRVEVEPGDPRIQEKLLLHQAHDTGVNMGISFRENTPRKQYMKELIARSIYACSGVKVSSENEILLILRGDKIYARYKTKASREPKEIVIGGISIDNQDGENIERAHFAYYKSEQGDTQAISDLIVKIRSSIKRGRKH